MSDLIHNLKRNNVVRQKRRDLLTQLKDKSEELEKFQQSHEYANIQKYQAKDTFHIVCTPEQRYDFEKQWFESKPQSFKQVLDDNKYEVYICHELDKRISIKQGNLEFMRAWFNLGLSEFSHKGLSVEMMGQFGWHIDSEDDSHYIIDNFYPLASYFNFNVNNPVIQEGITSLENKSSNLYDLLGLEQKKHFKEVEASENTVDFHSHPYGPFAARGRKWGPSISEGQFENFGAPGRTLFDNRPDFVVTYTHNFPNRFLFFIVGESIGKQLLLDCYKSDYSLTYKEHLQIAKNKGKITNEIIPMERRRDKESRRNVVEKVLSKNTDVPK